MAFQSMSNSFSADSRATGDEFPFVTLSTFETLAEPASRQSGVEVFTFSPIVTQELKPVWQEYSLAEQSWLQDSRKVAVLNPNGVFNASDYLPGSITPFIYDLVGTAPVPSVGHGPFLPAWQTSPPPFSPGFVNFNTLDATFLPRVFQSMLAVREAVLSGVENFAGLSSTAFKPEDHEEYHKQVVDYDKNETSTTYDHPHSLLMQPIFKTLHDHTSDVVGVLSGVVAWDRYLDDLLPEGINGLTCVLKNTCGQAYTYQLDGNRVSHRRTDRVIL